MSDEGLRCIDEIPDITTNLRAHVADLDLASTYPVSETITNASKETTYAELSQIKDVEHQQRLMIGINLTGGMTNALEIAQVALALPTTKQLLDAFMETKK